MRRLLRWLNRMPCGCVVRPNYGVVRDCWRHALLDWLTRRCVLVTDGDGAYYHDGYIEWRPWYWGERGPDWQKVHAKGFI